MKNKQTDVKVMQQRQTEPWCHAEQVINRLETAERINKSTRKQTKDHKGQVQPGNTTEK